MAKDTYALDVYETAERYYIPEQLIEHFVSIPLQRVMIRKVMVTSNYMFDSPLRRREGIVAKRLMSKLKIYSVLGLRH